MTETKKSWWRRTFARGRRAPADVDDALAGALLAVLDREFDEAEALLSAAVKLDSSRVEPYIALARFYRMRGEVGRAIRVHQNLLLRKDLSPGQRTEALADLAADFRRGGFLQRALAAYDEVLSRESKHVDALEALVSLAVDLSDYDRALDASRRLSKLVGKHEGNFPRAAALRAAQGRALLAQGRGDEARTLLKRALRKDASLIDGWIALGEIEFDAGRFPAAIDAWARVPELDRRKGRVVYPRLERAHAELGTRSKYLAFLRGQLLKRPGDGSAQVALATALAAGGAIEDALNELRQAAGRDSENLEIHSALGRLLLSEGKTLESEKAYAVLLEVLERRGQPVRTESFE